MKIRENILILLFLFSSGAFSQDDSLQTKLSNQKDYVYLLHGLGRNKTAMWFLASQIEEAGFSVKRIGYASLNKTPREILQNITGQINRDLTNARGKIHFAGHSLGGLLIRAYLDSNKVANLGRVVLIGTPNNGTPFVDKFRNNWLLKLFGPTTRALGTDKNSFPKTLPPPYYSVGVIAGISHLINNEWLLPGEDDGVVTIESTKIEGMADMVIVESGHSRMRLNREVARQTIEFLKNEKFSKDKIP